jgi:hypothetical protein
MLLFFAIKNSGISAARLQETKNPLAPGHAEDAALSSK